MGTHIRCAALALALLGAGGVQAQVIVEEQELVEAEPYDAEVEWRHDGSSVTRETFYEPDGSVVTRETVRVPPIVLSPLERRAIYASVRRPVVRERIVRENLIEERFEPAPPVRRGMVRGGVVGHYPVGSLLPETVELYAFAPRVIETTPSIRRYRYAVIDERVLVVDPATRIIVSEIYE